MADVFISYKREDRRMAERLSIALEQLGFSVWWDFDLLSGDQYRRAIRAVIDQCKAAIVLWSVRAIDSDFVMDEATYAKGQGKLCPARIDAVDLPFGFGQTHTDDLCNWDGELTHGGFQALVRAVEARVGRKGKLGTPQTADTQTASAELEAFKAAQLAGNDSALRSFVTRFPSGAFASFVRGQIEVLHAHAPAVAARVGAGAAAATSAALDAGHRLIGEAAKVAQPPPAPHPSAIKPLAGYAKWAVLICAAMIVAVIAARAISILTTKPPSELAKAEPAPTSAATRPYDLTQLDPNVQAAATEARAAQAKANDAAANARAAAARATASGVDCGAVSTGECVYRLAGDFAGDAYAGQRDPSGWLGYGVYSYGEHPPAFTALDRYEGQFALSKFDGVGTFRNGAGARYAGQFRGNVETGYGVVVTSDGSTYEGAFSNNLYSGYGVKWSSDGLAWSAGVWSAGVLTTPLGAQGAATPAAADFKR